MPRTCSALLLAVAAACGLALLATASPRTYRMTLDVDFASATYHGELTTTYENQTGAPLGELFFRLYPNAQVLYGSASLSVRAATIDGTPATLGLADDPTIAWVSLPEPLPPEGSVELLLSFEGRASAMIGDGFATPTEYGVLTRSEDALVLTAFYPVLAPYTEEGWAIDPVSAFGDPLFAETARYEVSIVSDSDLAAIPVADATTTDPDGRTRWTFERDGLRDFPLVLVRGERTVAEAVAADVTVRTWFLPRHAPAGDVALARALAAVDLYSALFGTPPYPSLDIVETPLQQAAGVESSGLFLVAASYAADPAALFYDIIVSHETAHQWFYAAVGNDPVEAPWLDESLATYASNLFLAVEVSEAAADAERVNWSNRYASAREAHPTLRITSPLYAFPDSSTYSSFVYSGGAWELDRARQTLGDDAFFGGIAAYYADRRFEVADADDLLRALGAAAGDRTADLSGLVGP